MISIPWCNINTKNKQTEYKENHVRLHVKRNKDNLTRFPASFTMKSILIVALAILAITGMTTAYGYGYGYGYTQPRSSIGNGGSKNVYNSIWCLSVYSTSKIHCFSCPFLFMKFSLYHCALKTDKQTEKVIHLNFLKFLAKTVYSFCASPPPCIDKMGILRVANVRLPTLTFLSFRLSVCQSICLVNEGKGSPIILLLITHLSV